MIDDCDGVGENFGFVEMVSCENDGSPTLLQVDQIPNFSSEKRSKEPPLFLKTREY
jgi:hypothetical protein